MDTERLNWICLVWLLQVRTLSFSHDGKYIASASEDLVIDIAEVETSECAHQIQCRSAMNSVAWNPAYDLLAYAGDDRDRDSREGVLRVFAF